MVRNKAISLRWILDNLIGVSGDNEIQCVSVNMGRLADVLPKTKRLQETPADDSASEIGGSCSCLTCL